MCLFIFTNSFYRTGHSNRSNWRRSHRHWALTKHPRVRRCCVATPTICTQIAVVQQLTHNFDTPSILDCVAISIVEHVIAAHCKMLAPARYVFTSETLWLYPYGNKQTNKWKKKKQNRRRSRMKWRGNVKLIFDNEAHNRVQRVFIDTHMG